MDRVGETERQGETETETDKGQEDSCLCTEPYTNHSFVRDVALITIIALSQCTFLHTQQPLPSLTEQTTLQNVNQGRSQPPRRPIPLGDGSHMTPEHLSTCRYGNETVCHLLASARRAWRHRKEDAVQCLCFPARAWSVRGFLKARTTQKHH